MVCYKGNIQTNTTVGDIKNNTNAQINVNSPNSNQIINQKKFISEAIIKKDEKGARHIIRITLIQAKGIWSGDMKFRIRIHLSGPYKKYTFVQGLPMVRMMQIIRDNKEKGLIDYSIKSAPLDKPIILEIESNIPVKIDNFYVEPNKDGKVIIKNL